MSMQILKNLKEDMKKLSSSFRKKYHRFFESRRHKRRRHKKFNNNFFEYFDDTFESSRRKFKTFKRNVFSRRTYTFFLDLLMSNTWFKTLSTISNVFAFKSNFVKSIENVNEQVNFYIRWQTRTHRILSRDEIEYKVFMIVDVILKDNFYDFRMIQIKKHDFIVDVW